MKSYRSTPTRTGNDIGRRHGLWPSVQKGISAVAVRAEFNGRERKR